MSRCTHDVPALGLPALASPARCALVGPPSGCRSTAASAEWRRAMPSTASPRRMSTTSGRRARSSPKRVKKEEGEVPAAAGPGGDRCGTVGRSRRAFRNGLAAADPGETSPDETREQGETSSSTRAWLPRSSPLRSAPRVTTWTGRGEEPPPSSANLTLSSGPLDKLWWGEPAWCAGEGGGGSSAVAAAASASCCRRTVGDKASISSGLSSEGVALTLPGTGCPGGGMCRMWRVGSVRPKCSASFPSSERQAPRVCPCRSLIHH